MTEPKKSRAIFSTEDFKLLQTALVHYLKTVDDRSELAKYSNLYHRLGRIG